LRRHVSIWLYYRKHLRRVYLDPIVLCCLCARLLGHIVCATLIEGVRTVGSLVRRGSRAVSSGRGVGC
jgi:hypothetical protein